MLKRMQKGSDTIIRYAFVEKNNLTGGTAYLHVHEGPGPGIGTDQPAETVHDQTSFPGLVAFRRDDFSQQTNEIANILLIKRLIIGRRGIAHRITHIPRPDPIQQQRMPLPFNTYVVRNTTPPQVNKDRKYRISSVMSPPGSIVAATSSCSSRR